MANVIDLFQKRRQYGKCDHYMHVEVDEELRRLYCQKCDEVLVVVEALWRLAQEPDSYRQAISRLEFAADRLRKSVKELKKEEQRIKARIRTAKKKLA